MGRNYSREQLVWHLDALLFINTTLAVIMVSCLINTMGTSIKQDNSKVGLYYRITESSH